MTTKTLSALHATFIIPFSCISWRRPSQSRSSKFISGVHVGLFSIAETPTAKMAPPRHSKALVARLAFVTNALQLCLWEYRILLLLVAYAIRGIKSVIITIMIFCTYCGHYSTSRRRRAGKLHCVRAIL